MLNNQDFMGWRSDVGSLDVKDQCITEREIRSDEDRLINGLKWRYDYFDHDQTDIHLQIVPEIHREEENSKKDLTLVVPDEHSEAGDHHLSKDNSESSDNRCYLRNKREKPKRRRYLISSDNDSEGCTREVPSVTRTGFKKIRRDEMMSNKMRTLQQLLPNCHKTDKVSILDKTIEYMKNLQLQLQVMSTMGMNPYIPPVTLNFGMHNHLLTAMAMAHGLNPANQTASSPLTPATNWPLPPLSYLSFPHSSNQPPLFLTTASAASSPQCLCGLAPCFPIKFP
ncbi:transcription factor HFR1 isoform X1 [Eutrema salsugineum]|uniref:transcription factor HFR1 isoform X1 n=1 Tax=Eutrema salsugineum TaxID=72664 RepID=UPI000CED3E48|nr:transcription factor HFR1 isoform X1 [Eutrema salsugineum]